MMARPDGFYVVERMKKEESEMEMAEVAGKLGLFLEQQVEA
jgi:hypothetical protein